ncbi:hypothetical protein N657DRAFT_676628 [Parathielavia appendiculata]|uniref:Uncharacterized protein n=1 Tax=Parathielavia appendiculata TaxID=2587402 RepID=A0AAN6UC87_9PEZI|nr:hypothetical protein N657DRAFT_676628 [Parathielavia appendiculata]
MTAPEVSHGRGGAGNINPDDTKYVDGEVVRVGEVGSHGDGAFSTGRGGAANIADAGVKQSARADKDLIPEAAIRPSTENTDYHTGRGGAGNEYVAKKDKPAEGGKPAAPVGLADKLKRRILGAFSKK